MNNWSQDKGRADCRECEVGLLLLQKFPCSLLREGFTCSVAVHWTLGCLFHSDRIPVGFGVCLVRNVVAFVAVHDGGEGGGDDDSLYGGSALLEGLEDACGTNDGRVEEVFLGILDVEVELIR